MELGLCPEVSRSHGRSPSRREGRTALSVSPGCGYCADYRGGCREEAGLGSG